MAIALGFNYRALMKTLDSQCDCNNEKAPTITSCMMNGVWTNNSFLLGSNSFDNHGGWFNCVFRQVYMWKLMGANLRWAIRMAS
jgi:hypothetical protein